MRHLNRQNRLNITGGFVSQWPKIDRVAGDKAPAGKEDQKAAGQKELRK
jgi:hypothetical protein